MEEDEQPKRNIPSLLLKGVLLGHQRMFEKVKEEDRMLVIMRDGTIVRLRAREL